MGIALATAEETVDLGLVLATVATAAAALVAIVGGLLVSRVVSLATERSGLIHRRDDLSGQLETERARLVDLKDRLLASDARYVLRPKYKQLAKPEPRIDLEAWIAEEEVDRTVDEIQAFLDEELARFTDARERLAPMFEEHGAPDFGFDDLVEAGIAKLPPGHRDIHDAVFEQLVDEHTPPAAEPTWAISVQTAYQMPEIFFSVGDHQEHAHLERQSDQTEHRISALEVQVEQASLALARVTQPVGLRAGVAVLAYFGSVGTLVPFAMMMAEPQLLPAAGWAAIGLFASGLVALLGYVIWQVKHLTDDDTHRR